MRINELGHVISQTTEGGYLWRDGTSIALDFAPRDFNDADAIVGLDREERAVLWRAGALTVLTEERALGVQINSRGQAAITGLSSDGQLRGLSWSEGALRDLGTLGGKRGTTTAAINARGEIVGDSQTTLPQFDGGRAIHAIVWSAGTLRDLGTLAALEESVATGINDSGRIVGIDYHSCCEREPVVWIDGLLTRLPRPSISGFRYPRSHPMINRAGVIASTGAIGVRSLLPLLWRPVTCGTEPDAGPPPDAAPPPDAGPPPPDDPPEGEQLE